MSLSTNDYAFCCLGVKANLDDNLFDGDDDYTEGDNGGGEHYIAHGDLDQGLEEGVSSPVPSWVQSLGASLNDGIGMGEYYAPERTADQAKWGHEDYVRLPEVKASFDFKQLAAVLVALKLSGIITAAQADDMKFGEWIRALVSGDYEQTNGELASLKDS